MCQGYIVNWTCDASGGNHIVCYAHSGTMETFYLNWTDCKYTETIGGISWKYISYIYI